MSGADERGAPGGRTPGPGPRAWLPHAGLALAALAGFGLVRAQRVPTVELERRLAEGTVAERLDALFVLARRDAPRRFGPELVRALLAADDPRLREVAFTSSLTREAPRRLQRARLRALDDPAELARCTWWLPLEPRDRAARTPHAELARYLDAAADRAP